MKRCPIPAIRPSPRPLTQSDLVPVRGGAYEGYFEIELGVDLARQREAA